MERHQRLKQAATSPWIGVLIALLALWKAWVELRKEQVDADGKDRAAVLAVASQQDRLLTMLGNQLTENQRLQQELWARVVAAPAVAVSAAPSTLPPAPAPQPAPEQPRVRYSPRARPTPRSTPVAIASPAPTMAQPGPPPTRVLQRLQLQSDRHNAANPTVLQQVQRIYGDEPTK